MSQEGIPVPAAAPASETTRDTCWLMTCVVDIRNFTELTARVEGIVQSTFIDRQARADLLDVYRQFMVTTQSLAIQMFRDTVRTLGEPWAIKSTGDGMMVTIMLQDVDLKLANGPDPRLDLDIVKVQPKLKAIVNTLVDVIHDSYRSGKRPGGALSLAWEIIDFVEHHGGLLGFSKDTHGLGLAGGCALGLGSFVTILDSPLGEGLCATPSTQTPGAEMPARHLDANGHAVNLAFRLCGAAARPAVRSDSGTPELLIQRQAMHLLKYHDGRGITAWSPPEGFKLDPIRFEEPLKGIEDSWCYGIRFKHDKAPK